MRTAALLVIALAMAGCIQYGDGGAYTRAETDAINAEAACKAQARNLLQVARCERRR